MGGSASGGEAQGGMAEGGMAEGGAGGGSMGPTLDEACAELVSDAAKKRSG